MNICVVGLRGIPRVLGGVETHCEQLFPRLKTLRPNDAFTIIARKRYVSRRVLEFGGLRIVALGHAKAKYLETITNTLYGVLYAKCVLKADLIHVHGIGPALAVPLARALNLKVVVTYHSKNYEHRKWNKIAKVALQIGELCAVVCANRIVAISPSLVEDLKCRFPKYRDKIRFIPNGADHLAQSGPLRVDADEFLAKYNFARKQYILSAGRLVPEKGFHDLIEAFRAADLDCKLAIAGDATQRDTYSEGLLAHASDRIVFTGFVSGPELQILLQNASLFVLPSHNEGLPLAALEAAAAGAPLLLSDIMANRDLGLPPENYFKARDISDLTEKLQSDHSRFRVDRDQLMKKYNWNAVCAQTDELYSSLQDACSPGASLKVSRQSKWLASIVRYAEWAKRQDLVGRGAGAKAPSAQQSKYVLFQAGFRAIAATRADRWLRPIAQGCGIILTFHHVRPQHTRPFAPNALLEITPEFLDTVLAELNRTGFEIVPLDAVPDRLRSGARKRPFAVLTFDDGYRDNVQYAWPVLRRYGAPWTLFVTTDFADGSGQLWWLELEQALARLDEVTLSLEDGRLQIATRAPHEKQRAFETLFRRLRAGSERQLRKVTADLADRAGVCRRDLVTGLCLNWDDLQLLIREPDVTIGAHTCAHPILAGQEITTARREILDSKAILEHRLGRPVRHFAYPGGDSTCAGPREFRLAQEAGFVSAVTTRPGHVFPQHLMRLQALPRVSVNGLFQTRTALRALLSGVPFLAWNRARVAGLESE